MTEDYFGREKRRFLRVVISKSVRAKAEEETYKGSMKDISASGVAVYSDAGLEKELAVELEIEDFGRFLGRVARSFDGGLAFEFDIDDIEQERLITEIEKLHDTIRKEDI